MFDESPFGRRQRLRVLGCQRSFTREFARTAFPNRMCPFGLIEWGLSGNIVGAMNQNQLKGGRGVGGGGGGGGGEGGARVRAGRGRPDHERGIIMSKCHYFQGRLCLRNSPAGSPGSVCDDAATWPPPPPARQTNPGKLVEWLPGMSASCNYAPTSASAVAARAQLHE